MNNYNSILLFNKYFRMTRLEKIYDDQNTLLATLFCAKAFKNDLTGIKGMLMAGISPNFQDPEGRTPLHIAAEEGHKEICTLLIEYGADINIKDAHGRTAAG